MSKKMLINVMHPEEARVAIVHDGRLMELNIEISGKEQTKGNIYKGVVLRVEPGLQAAFIDIGRAKPGFLQMGELHPDFWQWRDDVPEDQRKRRPRIQEVLRRGQELLVQVEKDERDNKGAALTTYVSMPGRYMVIMPGSDSSGISRKVEQEGARKKLKEIVAGMNIPEGIGYIIRTEAVGRTPEELQKDLDSLVGMYEGIKQSATEINGAGEVYRDSGLIIRFIRDYFSDDIDEVLVDSKDAVNEAKAFFRENMPTCEKLVKLHKEKRPIFSRFQLEEQIDQIYEKRVTLPSGGSLIIEPTEALVSIDVNSGKSSGERGIEDTAFKTNMEAAEEVARQLRLRDLGGLIVIDFIDMRDRKHNQEVEKVLKQALKMDKARVNLGRISDFGMLEMSRQRIAKTLNDAIHLACPHCEGRGKVKSVEAMALSFLRKVHGAAAKGNIAEVHGGLPLEVAYYLLNRKKRELSQIEDDYDIEVTVKGKTSFLLNQLELETVKREKPRADEIARVETEIETDPIAAVPIKVSVKVAVDDEPQAEESAATEGVKKRKRRRKKKKHGAESGLVEAASETAETADSDELIAPIPDALEAPAETGIDTAGAEGEAGAKPKKRKRRRSRKGHKEIEAETATEAVDTVELHEPEPAAAEPPQAADDEPVVAKKSKRPSAPRKKKETGSTKEPIAAIQEAAVETIEVVPPPAKKARRKPAKKAAEPVAEVVEAAADKPKRAPRSRKKAPAAA
ncbi:MAG: ribonuclease E [Geobacteraceae bacterium GWC2_55_20]|nr:MAG: ribonuclease E [Geobacteraceae bacterium GWC2_55_20]OGU22726.1 MAG: ribonuclease E [Geobacteraceae bacterium GWF2_54_21]